MNHFSFDPQPHGHRWSPTRLNKDPRRRLGRAAAGVEQGDVGWDKEVEAALEEERAEILSGPSSSVLLVQQIEKTASGIVKVVSVQQNDSGMISIKSLRHRFFDRDRLGQAEGICASGTWALRERDME